MHARYASVNVYSSNIWQLAFFLPASSIDWRLLISTYVGIGFKQLNQSNSQSVRLSVSRPLCTLSALEFLSNFVGENVFTYPVYEI